MNTKLRKWVPIALCCLPGVAIAAIIGVGIALRGAVVGASLGGPLSIGLIVLSVLACPLSMYLMMWMMNKNMGSDSHQSMSGTDADRLNALCKQRQTLDQEIAETQKIMELEEKKKALTRTAATKSASDSQPGLIDFRQ